MLVAGGGPAGAAAAIVLRRHGASVTVVDADRKRRWRPGESLAPHAKPLLERLGVLDRLAAGPHTACLGNRSAWGESALADTDFLFHPYGPGWHLDRSHFDRMLAEAARQDGSRCRTGRVGAVQRHRDHWLVSVEGGTIRARYLVDATGRGARLARRAGATVLRADRLVALTARLPAPAGRRGAARTSLVESAPFGWWYTAPLPTGESVVMAMTDADLAAQHALHRPERWRRELMETVHVGGLVNTDAGGNPSPVLCVTRAATSCAHPAAGQGWAAVGDAATASDPIAARGIPTALATGIAAADAIHADAAGSPTALSAYAAGIRSADSEFLRARLVCYRRERRWDTPFWTRRR